MSTATQISPETLHTDDALSVEQAHRFDKLAGTLRDAFWVGAISIVACFLFFVLLGALHPGQVIGLTIAMAILAGLYSAHAYLQSRARDLLQRDPRLRAARERRGF